MELIIKAKDIRVEYSGRDVLDIDELELYAYDKIGLIGNNGAGKSTLMNILSGEFSPAGCTVQRLGGIAHIKQLDSFTLYLPMSLLAIWIRMVSTCLSDS